MGLEQKYSMEFLDRSLNKLQKKGSFTLKKRYYRHANNIKEYNRFNEAFVNFEGKNVIDIGTHIGYYATVISSFSNSVIGIDVLGKSIKQAISFKNIIGLKNINFLKMSAYDLDDKFFEEHEINAMFNHKTIGKEKFPPVEFVKLMQLCERHCDIIITDKIDRIKDFFAKKYDFYPAQEIRSYAGNRLYIIKKR
jgi:2-polyprenyl-3-methyl-5-hydroxy-6-metoxy-1,4-benzoquinol methylase